MTDLWPNDLRAVQLRAPVAILREQAALLGEKTQNIVEARVRDFTSFSTNPSPGNFYFSFEIWAPTVRSYSYRLFTMSHGIEIYPLTLGTEQEIAKEVTNALGKAEPETSHVNIRVPNEAGLLNILRLILGSEKTKLIVRALLAQAQGLSTPALEVDQEQAAQIDVRH